MIFTKLYLYYYMATIYLTFNSNSRLKKTFFILEKYSSRDNSITGILQNDRTEFNYIIMDNYRWTIVHKNTDYF